MIFISFEIQNLEISTVVDSSKEEDILLEGVNYKYSVNATEIIGKFPIGLLSFEIVLLPCNHHIVSLADYLDVTTSSIYDNITIVSSSLTLDHNYILYLILLLFYNNLFNIV